MPNHKHHRGKVVTRDDVHNNNHAEQGNVNDAGGARQERQGQATMIQCCVPAGCEAPGEYVDESDPGDAVKVFCNNEQCTMGRWMHKNCFETWQQSVLAYLRSCGRARSWSEKQRLQNLWTKKGYDLAFKACDCKCGRGHLRKDLDYFPKPKPVDNNNRAKKRNKKKNDKPMAVLTTTSKGTQNHNHVTHQASSPPIQNNPGNSNFNNNNNLNLNVNPVNPVIIHRPELRNRTSSFSSTGSSPPNSAGSGSPTPMSPTGGVSLKKGFQFEFFCADSGPVITGSIFKRRSDFTAFSILPRHKQNPYHIKMEDEGPHGNDDTRCFVLSNLSSYKVTTIECVLCKVELPVFDRYPLLDGTFFLSPQPYSDGVVQVLADGRVQYLNAVCVSCLEGATDVRCYACKSKWDGSALLLGTMYSYDIFAAMPCCQKRLTCKTCRRAVVDVNAGLPFYSEYSRCIECPYCKRKDTHFIRPLSETFHVRQSIWK
ncbi:headcase protein-like [Liolophura sinensis]|uniref:headcase protein-like n=1 Tax=Liolophura sinensis TaxID=3198878 RepID=UPI0031582974